ncbi:nickel-dependent lactate racemase family protein [Microlunatus kandeliicorticis]|nr:nickel-dependent lactate racemase [Microlunatus kandeliicorticis]
MRLPYGRGRLEVALPPDAEVTVVRQRPLPALDDPSAAIADALAHPVDAAPLAELARGRSSACIVICDITRPVPNGLFLRPMISTLIEAGIPATGITVLVATGLHRPNLGDELAELVGDPWVLEHVRVVNHDARDDDRHVSLGRTPTRGTPVVLDRALVEAELRIVTGLVEPHFMAGWSGGRKVVAPGCAHHTVIRTFHSARFMGDPQARECNLEGNPLHEEQLQIVRMLGEVYALNTVIDEDRALVDVTFGEVVASHAASVAHVRTAIQVPVGRRFATVLTSAAGYPLDKTYYQTVKAMVTPLDILEPGGTLLVASECSEGLGSPEYRDAQTRLVGVGPEDFLASLWRKELADVDEWQTQMQLKSTGRARVRLFTDGLAAGDRALTGVELVDDLAAAVEQSMIDSGSREIAVVPDGPYVIPVV